MSKYLNIIAIVYIMLYYIDMDNNTIEQFVNDNVEGEPEFKGYVVEDLKERVNEHPEMSLSELLPDAIEYAFGAWEMDKAINW